MFSAAVAASAGDTPAETKGWRVTVAAPAKIVAGQPAIFPVEIKVLSGHHIYKESTKISAPQGAGYAVGSVDFPKAATVHDKFENRDMEVYDEGTYSFPVAVSIDKVGPATVTLAVKSRACTSQTCLFPVTQMASVDVVVAVAKADASPTGTAALLAAVSVARAPRATPAPSAAAGHATGVAVETPGLSAPSASPASTAAEIAVAVPEKPTPAPAKAALGLRAALSDETGMEELIRTRFLFALMIAFIGGLAISLTPCVYPMIPITISIIGAHSTTRSRGFVLSLIYVSGICVVYTALALVAALSSREFGFLLQSPWVRLGIAAVFTGLAASMFGAFHLELPSSVATRLSTFKGDGHLGIFVTGLFSGIVAGPCTAPVLLGILVAISTGVIGVVRGAMLMLAFSMGMGVLFVVIGTFSGMLNSLPKSGAWMVRVKHIFGFLLLGAALYYGQTAMPQSVFAVALGATMVFAGIHLGALTRLAEEAGELVKAAKAAGMVAAAAGLYFVVAGAAAFGVAPQPFFGAPAASGIPIRPVTASLDPEIHWLTSEADGRAESARSGKPMLIDFFATWCLDCKELDAEVYPDPRVVDEARGFVPVKVDTTIQTTTTQAETDAIEALKTRYDVKGLPRVVFVKPDGSVIHGLSVTGKVEPADFLDRMTKALDASKAPPPTHCDGLVSC